MRSRRRGEKVFEVEGLLGRQETRTGALLAARTEKIVMAVAGCLW